MKKRVILLIVLCAICLTGFAQAISYPPFERQEIAHEIAVLARKIGLPEDDPIIKRAQQVWWDANDQFCYDRDIIATVVYNEAWGGCSMRHRELVAAVVLNRVESDRFPSTVYDVVTQPRQYRAAYANPNSFYGRRARADAYAWKTCQEIATKALRGEVECPANVVFQANFRQGTGIYEIHKTSYSTSYFCYL